MWMPMMGGVVGVVNVMVVVVEVVVNVGQLWLMVARQLLVVGLPRHQSLTGLVLGLVTWLIVMMTESAQCFDGGDVLC